jgi:5-methylcytosine-specific restriction endonuclease McrA
MPCDYSKYPKNWKVIRTEVLERSGHKCEECGVENYGIYFDTPKHGRVKHDGSHATDEWVSDWNYKCVKIVLTISHTDHDVTNNGEPGNRPNLRALCQRCHLRHDADLHKANAAETRRRNMGTGNLFEP